MLQNEAFVLGATAHKLLNILFAKSYIIGIIIAGNEIEGGGIMKKLFGVVAVAVILSLGFNTVSYAGDEGWAAAGGLLGGLILGSAISDHHHYYGCGHSYAAPVYYSRPVYYHTPYAYPVYTPHTTYGGCYPSTTYVEYWY